MDTQDTTGFEPNFGKFWPRRRECQWNVVLHMARSKQKAWNYDHSIVAARDRLDSIGEGRFCKLNVCMSDIELRPTCPKLCEQLLEFQIRGRFTASVTDN